MSGRRSSCDHFWSTTDVLEVVCAFFAEFADVFRFRCVSRCSAEAVGQVLSVKLDDDCLSEAAMRRGRALSLSKWFHDLDLTTVMRICATCGVRRFRSLELSLLGMTRNGFDGWVNVAEHVDGYLPNIRHVAVVGSDPDKLGRLLTALRVHDLDVSVSVTQTSRVREVLAAITSAFGVDGDSPSMFFTNGGSASSPPNMAPSVVSRLVGLQWCAGSANDYPEEVAAALAVLPGLRHARIATGAVASLAGGIEFSDVAPATRGEKAVSTRHSAGSLMTTVHEVVEESDRRQAEEGSPFASSPPPPPSGSSDSDDSRPCRGDLDGTMEPGHSLHLAGFPRACVSDLTPYFSATSPALTAASRSVKDRTGDGTISRGRTGLRLGALESLHLQKFAMTASALRILQSTPRLRTLTLNSLNLNDSGLAPFLTARHLPHLEVLSLSRNPELSAPTMAAIAGLGATLRELHLDECTGCVGPDGFDAFARSLGGACLRRVRVLGLAGTSPVGPLPAAPVAARNAPFGDDDDIPLPVSEEALAAADVAASAATAAFAAFLAAFPRLRHLSLANASLPDHAVQAAGDCPAAATTLKELSISGGQISDAAILHLLSRCPRLLYADLSRTVKLRLDADSYGRRYLAHQQLSRDNPDSGDLSKLPEFVENHNRELLVCRVEGRHTAAHILLSPMVERLLNVLDEHLEAASTARPWDRHPPRFTKTSLKLARVVRPELGWS